MFVLCWLNFAYYSLGLSGGHILGTSHSRLRGKDNNCCDSDSNCGYSCHNTDTTCRAMSSKVGAYLSLSKAQPCTDWLLRLPSVYRISETPRTERAWGNKLHWEQKPGANPVIGSNPVPEHWRIRTEPETRSRVSDLHQNRSNSKQGLLRGLGDTDEDLQKQIKAAA